MLFKKPLQQTKFKKNQFTVKCLLKSSVFEHNTKANSHSFVVQLSSECPKDEFPVAFHHLIFIYQTCSSV